MLNLAVGATFLLAAVSLVGGVIGYVSKDSMKSLVAGVASAILLGLGAWVGRGGRTWGLILALVVCVALAGRFLPVYLKDTSAIWPSLVMVVLGLAAAGLLVAAIIALRKA